MKLLFIHSKYIKYVVKKKTKIAEPIEKKEDEMSDCLVVFITIEKVDESKEDTALKDAESEIIRTLNVLKEKNVMLFPFAHLSSILSHPDTAIKLLKELEINLAKHDLNVKRAPFGWNKEFELKSKGHPMAVLSKTVCPISHSECDLQCPYCKYPINSE